MIPPWVFNIPCCGGWCAPTRSPEKSWLRHVSNEYTIPAAKCFMKCAPSCEWSTFCIRLGKTGVVKLQEYRAQVMLSACTVSFIGFVLIFYAWLGIFLNPGLIVASSWGQGVAHRVDASGQVDPQPVFATWAGARGRVDQVNCNVASNRTRCEDTMLIAFEGEGQNGIYRRTVKWDWFQVCGVAPAILLNVSAVPGLRHSCAECAKQASGLTQMVSLALLSQFAQMMTNLQRTTVFGDVNCQNGVGVITGCTGLITTLSSLLMFWGMCARVLPKSLHEEVVIYWRLGPAFWCLLTATVLKINDITVHWLLATPKARHVPPPIEKRTDLLDFMMRSVEQPDDGDAEDMEGRSSSAGDLDAVRKSQESVALLAKDSEQQQLENGDDRPWPPERHAYWEVGYDMPVWCSLCIAMFSLRSCH